MVKQHRDLDRRQQGIVKGYYKNEEALMLQKLGAFISDLYICTDRKKAESIWGRVEKALANTRTEPQRIAEIVRKRNLTALAELVTELHQPGPKAAEAKEPGGTDEQPPPTPTPTSATTTTDGPGQAGGTPKAAPPVAATIAGGASPTDPATLKSALKAFRKRLKLTRLSDESKLGVGPMTAGRKSDIMAIEPPRQFPRETWDALVEAGRLKNAGHGFYELIE